MKDKGAHVGHDGDEIEPEKEEEPETRLILISELRLILIPRFPTLPISISVMPLLTVT